MRTRTWTWGVAAALGGLGALLAGAAPDAAAKGGGGSGGGTTVDPGVVYFRTEPAGIDPSVHVYHRMNPDGSAKTQLPPGVGGQPSYLLHGDTTAERWFLRVESGAGTFATGDQHAEIVLMNEGGDRRVTVTDLVASNVVPDHSGTGNWLERTRWAGQTDDARFSFEGYHVGTSSETEWGIFVVEVDWADVLDGGTYTPGATTLLTGFTSTRSGGPVRTAYPGYYQNFDYAWSPDGTKIAYAGRDAVHTWNLRMRDLAAGTDVLVRTAAWPHDWSSTGKVVCTDAHGYGLFSVAPDGSSYVELAPAPRTGGPMANLDGRWSPAGNQLVYAFQNLTAGDPAKRYIDVRRVSALGTGDTNLTGDLSGWVRPVGWRR